MRHADSPHEQGIWSILRWAAGAEMEPPQHERVDERRLMELVVAHRLGPRLLRRLKTSQLPAWCSGWALAHLRSQSAKSTAQIAMRMRALREMCASLPGAPPLIIKGFSAYAATGERRFLRPSGDLDLLAPDDEALLRGLEGLGYGIVHAPASAHELATAGRGSVGIEIHRFFPVYALPSGVGFGSLDACKYLQQDFAAPARREVSYADIEPHAVPARVPELPGVRVPDVTTTAFLLCAHEFRELIHSPFELPIPVRLALLADIHELSHHADFDCVRFQQLAERFGGASSVRLAGHFLRQVFGAHALPGAPALNPPEARLPRQIGVRGAWATLSTARECLLGQSRASLLGRLESALGTHQVLTHTLRGEPFSVSIEASRRGDTVELQVLAPRLPSRDGAYRMRLDTPERSLVADVGGAQHGSHPSEAAVEESAGGYRVRWALAAQGRALLSVARRDRRTADFYDADCVVVSLLTLPGSP